MRRDYVKRTRLLMGSVRREEQKGLQNAVALLRYNVKTTSFTDKPRNGHTLNRLYKCLIYCRGRPHAATVWNKIFYAHTRRRI